MKQILISLHQKIRQDAKPEPAARPVARRHRALALGLRRGLLRAGASLRHAGRGVGAGLHRGAGGHASKEFFLFLAKREKIGDDGDSMAATQFPAFERPMNASLFRLSLLALRCSMFLFMISQGIKGEKRNGRELNEVINHRANSSPPTQKNLVPPSKKKLQLNSNRQPASPSAFPAPRPSSPPPPAPSESASPRPSPDRPP